MSSSNSVPVGVAALAVMGALESIKRFLRMLHCDHQWQTEQITGEPVPGEGQHD